MEQGSILVDSNIQFIEISNKFTYFFEHLAPCQMHCKSKIQYQ
jgi:hypothetical protein